MYSKILEELLKDVLEIKQTALEYKKEKEELIKKLKALYETDEWKSTQKLIKEIKNKNNEGNNK